MDAAGNAVAIRPGEHACCRLAHAADRRRLAMAFVRAGLRRGDKVLYITARRDSATLAAQLAADLLLAPALASRRLELRDAHDTYVPDGAFDAGRTLDALHAEHRHALDAGYSGLSVTGEMDWAVSGDVPGSEELGAYERSFGASDADGTFSVFCQYDHGRFAPGTLQEVADAHPVDISPELGAVGRFDGRLAAARIGAGPDELLRLSGELDDAAAYVVESVLRTHFPGGLALDLADVDFVDVAGMRALWGGGAQPPHVVAASPAVHRLLGWLMWDTAAPPAPRRAV